MVGCCRKHFMVQQIYCWLQVKMLSISFCLHFAAFATLCKEHIAFARILAGWQCIRIVGWFSCVVHIVSCIALVKRFASSMKYHICWENIEILIFNYGQNSYITMLCMLVYRALLHSDTVCVKCKLHIYYCFDSQISKFTA